MIKNKYRINVPFEERTFITPDTRKRAFKEIYKGYEKRYNVKLLYAFLNRNPDLELDYGVIYKTMNDDKTHEIIIYDMVPIFSDRCTPSYVYYVKTGNREKFYKFGIEEMVVKDPVKFYNFLNVRCLVNNDKESDKYWKNPKYGEEICSELLDFGLPYVKKEYT